MAKLKLTKELIAKVSDLISRGLTKKAAASGCLIDESTFYRWFNQGEADAQAGKTKTIYYEFYKSIKEAEANFKKTHMATIASASFDDWKAAAWILERCYKDEYGKAQDINVAGQPGGEPIRTESAVQIYLPDNGRD